jgi:hypothetical protein
VDKKVDKASAEEPFLNALWKLAYARRSFEEVQAACDYLSAQKLSPEDAGYNPLVVAIHVIYARPFKHSRGGIKQLSADLVPEKFRDVHRQMILVRDQVVAHLDANASKLGDLPANHVRIVVTPAGAVNLRTNEVTARKISISQIRGLAAALGEEITRLMAELARSVGPQTIPRKPGEYLIDLVGQQFVWLAERPGQT